MSNNAGPGADRAGEPKARELTGAPAGPVVWLIKGLGPGGAEQLLLQHAQILEASARPDAVLYVAGYKSQLAPQFERLGIETLAIGGVRGRSPLWPIRLRRELKSRKAVLVHVHSPSVAVVARLVARSVRSAHSGGQRRRRRPALVYTEHNRWQSYRWPTRIANMATFALNDAAIAVSSDARDSMPPRFRERTVVIQHGIDVGGVRSEAGEPDDARKRAREQFGVGADAFVVGIIANCREEKDLGNLVAAVDHLNRHAGSTAAERVVVVHIGQGPLEGEFARWRAEAGVEDRLVSLGHRPNARSLMWGFDAITLSSRHEGLPVVLMEAAACGIAMVCTDVGGVKSICIDGLNGMLVPPSRPDSLAQAWVQLAEHPELVAAMGAASTDVAGRFDVGRSAVEIAAVYESAMSIVSGASMNRAPAGRVEGKGN